MTIEIVPLIMFFCIIVMFALVHLRFLLLNEENIYSTIAYKFRKRKIDKDFYCFVRRFRVLKYYNRHFAETPTGKTIRTIIRENCSYNFMTEISLLKGTQQDIQAIENTLKILKYTLYRLENSKEYKNLIFCFENDSSNSPSLKKILFNEELDEMHLNAIRCIFSATVDFLIAISQNESLHSVNTDIYFNNKNLLKNYCSETIKFDSYNEYINQITGLKLYKHL